MNSSKSNATIDDLCAAVRVRATRYGKGSVEQNLTYACEELVTETWPSAVLQEHLVRSTVDTIAMVEGWIRQLCTSAPRHGAVSRELSANRGR